jgi:flagellar biosynthetic protein FliQ
MSPQAALDLVNLTLLTAFKLSAPILITTIVVGLVVNILQTVTSLRDSTLSFVPKLVAAAAVTIMTLPWGIQTMTGFFTTIYAMLGQGTAN